MRGKENCEREWSEGAFGCGFLAESRRARGGSFPCLFSESLELEREGIVLASGDFSGARGRVSVELERDVS